MTPSSTEYGGAHTPLELALYGALKPFADAFELAFDRLKNPSIAELNTMASHHLHGAAFQKATLLIRQIDKIPLPSPTPQSSKGEEV